VTDEPDTANSQLAASRETRRGERTEQRAQRLLPVCRLRFQLFRIEHEDSVGAEVVRPERRFAREGGRHVTRPIAPSFDAKLVRGLTHAAKAGCLRGLVGRRAGSGHELR